MKLFRTVPSTLLLSLCLLTAPSFAQENIQSKTSGNAQPTQTNFNKEQILTATVHQAWLLSGKNEANFFEIVEQLAEISAANRSLTLPDSEADGRRLGEYIKQMAKTDTNQLLYAVVDKAVVMITKSPAHPAGSKTTPKS